MKILSLIHKSVQKITGYRAVPVHHFVDHPVTRDHLYDVYFSTIDPKDFFFIQIGAHDGKHADPNHHYVTKYGLAGIVVEPQPDVFKKLQHTYAAYPRVRCVNAAVGKSDGTNTLYAVKDWAKTPENFDKMTRLASFDRSFVKKHLKNRIPKDADPEQYIEELTVTTLTFDTLVKDVPKIDFLQIDAEGFDWEILKIVDLERWKPKILNFESTHLPPEDKAASEQYLTDHGYTFFYSKSDTCAYRP